MADRIKGITVEIGGDTTALSKALSGVNREISSTQSQLKDVERLLKLDPTNTELLEQRQRLLSDAVEKTGEKLQTLKTAEQQAQEQFAKGEMSQAQYDALQREIVATEQSLKALEERAASSNAKLSQVGAAADKFSAATGKVADKTKGLSAAAGGLLGALGGAAVKAVKSADDLNTLAKQTGFSTAELQKMQYAADLVDVSMETITGAAGKMKKNMVSDSADTVAAFERIGVSVRDEVTGELRDSTEVFYEVLEGLSGITNETERDVVAMQLFGKSADQLAGVIDDGGAALKSLGQEAEDLGLILGQDTLDSLNNVNDELDTLKAKAQGELAATGAKAMEALLPVIDKVVDGLGSLLEWVGSLDEGQIQMIITIAAVIAAVSPVFGIISKVSGGISTVTTLLSKLSTAGLLGPMGIIAAVIALVAIIATKGDEIQAILQRVDDFLQGVFSKDWTEVFGPVLGGVLNAFFQNLKNIWDGIKEIFDGIIDFVRGVFTGDWERAWEGVKEIFGGIFDSLAGLAKTPINGVIGIINGAIGGINTIIDKIDSISFDLPAILGGGHVGFDIGHIGTIPLLANGGILSSGSAVVGDAGPELLTMLGGRAVVQPLSDVTNDSLRSMLGGVVNGMQTVMGGGSAPGPIHIHLDLDGRELATAQVPYLIDASSANGTPFKR